MDSLWLHRFSVPLDFPTLMLDIFPLLPGMQVRKSTRLSVAVISRPHISQSYPKDCFAMPDFSVLDLTFCSDFGILRNLTSTMVWHVYPCGNGPFIRCDRRGFVEYARPEWCSPIHFPAYRSIPVPHDFRADHSGNVEENMGLKITASPVSYL